MDRFKVLAIAPYQGLRDLILDLAKEQNELEIHTYVADMHEGVELVKSFESTDFHCIISRAGTAELIRKATNIPVIDIKISVIDMISTIKLAQNYSGTSVIVGFKSITETANIVRQLNEYDVDIQTVTAITEIEECLNRLKQKGVSLIIGDVITVKYAKRMGFHTILVTSGKESVLRAFEDALHLSKQLFLNEQKRLLMKSLLDNESTSVICFNEYGQMVYSNLENTIEYEKVLEEWIEPLIRKQECRFLKQIGNHFVNIRGKSLNIQGTAFAAFYIEEEKDSPQLFDPAISISDCSDLLEVNLDTFSTTNPLLKRIVEDAQVYSKTTNPILLIGEKGTGKDTLAHAIYRGSPLGQNPLVVINTKYMTEKKWNNLLNSDKSFFTKRDWTIYIKDLHYIEKSSGEMLESFLLNTFVSKRNRFIISCTIGFSKFFDESSLLKSIRNEFGAFPLILPNLQNRKEDIPSLASLFVGEFNLKYGKQVAGLEKGAIKRLQDFRWTHNIDQLKRVIEQLILQTDSFFINEKTVEKVLSNEELPVTSTAAFQWDLNKTLDEINKDIIRLVLAEENFNQSKAADRLGISRSTLWRKLK